MFRDGESRLEVENSGLAIFVYDEANALTIEKEGDSLFDAYSSLTSSGDKRLAEMGKKGLLLGYELAQDDGRDLVVILGPPLSKEEEDKGRWLTPQRALLNLPSGRVRIDSFETLRLGQWKLENQDAPEGASIQVPPGDYVATLYRTDRVLLEDAEIETEGFPTEVLVLTPSNQAVPVDQPNSFLPYVHKKPKLAWEGAYTVSNGSFRGQVVKGGDTITTNLDRAAAESLGLQAGKRIQVTAGKSLQLEALFIAEMEQKEYVRRYGRPKKPGGCVAYWWEHLDTGGTAVLVLGDEEDWIKPYSDGTEKERWPNLKKKTPIEITVLP